MHSSDILKSSAHCKPSPNGRFIATLDGSAVIIRSTETLQVTNVVKLTASPGLGSSSASASLSSVATSSLHWASSSSKCLVFAANKIEVFSIAKCGSGSSFRATVCNPTSLSNKPPLVQFGARDTEVLFWPSSGLKLVIFDLSNSKTVEIGSPKFYHSTSASRGLSLRPGSGHLALLTRTGGKDFVSLHHHITRQVEHSWSPDTVDAQGLMWSPDGKWLVVWESPAQGYRLFLYAADGQLFRSIGPSSITNNPDAELDPGIKTCQFSPDAQLCALGDHGRGIAVFQTESWRVALKLFHPATLVPSNTLQVWQEQLSVSASDKRSTHSFLRATQILLPPGPFPEGKASVESKTGCSVAEFDSSSTLLATRLDDSPGTIWIWDIAAAELRAALVFHTTATIQWHPKIRELLLITCQDAGQHGVMFTWDPLSNGPVTIVAEDHLPNPTTAGKIRTTWVNRQVEFPILLVSDMQHCVLLSPMNSSDGVNPWQAAKGSWEDGGFAIDEPSSDRDATQNADDTSLLEDTFSFRNTLTGKIQ